MREREKKLSTNFEGNLFSYSPLESDDNNRITIIYGHNHFDSKGAGVVEAIPVRKLLRGQSIRIAF